MGVGESTVKYGKWKHFRERKRSCWKLMFRWRTLNGFYSGANVRFMVMSEGQYELARSVVAGNNRSQSGLELDVIDHYNGTRRSVKTLSGGESFKASLSLALGLSDEVQSRAGGNPSRYDVCGRRFWLVGRRITGAGNKSPGWIDGRQ